MSLDCTVFTYLPVEHNTTTTQTGDLRTYIHTSPLPVFIIFGRAQCFANMARRLCTSALWRSMCMVSSPAQSYSNLVEYTYLTIPSTATDSISPCLMVAPDAVPPTYPTIAEVRIWSASPPRDLDSQNKSTAPNTRTRNDTAFITTKYNLSRNINRESRTTDILFSFSTSSIWPSLILQCLLLPS